MRSHVKAFPCGFHGMGPATAAAQLHARIVDGISGVREIRVHATRISAHLMASNESRWKPETRETADHSIPFVVAMVLMEGSLEIRYFDEEYYKRPEVRDFMAKIRIVTPDTFEDEFHRVPEVVVEVEMASGEVHSARCTLPLGHPENPMTEKDYERKFRSLASTVLSDGQMNELLHCLRNLEKLDDIGEMLALTVPA
jgi:2-methylcitrate dehydratase